MSGYRLYGHPGTGSTIVEHAFATAGVEVEVVDIPWEETGWGPSRLTEINPLGQVPTLVLPDGSLMTETAAIVLHLADIRPDAGLAPPADSPLRPRFLRWLVFLVSAVYPTFTYGDVPERWVGEEGDAARRLVQGTDAHRLDLYRQMEGEAGSPWFLGETFSAIDLYLRVMIRWRPRREWFERNCPRIAAIADEAGRLPAVRQVESRPTATGD